MGSNKKSLLSLGLAALVLIIFGFQFKNGDTLKGQITNSESSKSSVSSDKADLTCDIEAQNSESGDVTVDVTITNLGPGSIDGSSPFKYGIYIDDQLVFENIDSYSTMEAADSFAFSYPISKAIYQYGDSGMVECIVDVDSNISEADETNNNATDTY